MHHCVLCLKKHEVRVREHADRAIGRDGRRCLRRDSPGDPIDGRAVFVGSDIGCATNGRGCSRQRRRRALVGSRHGTFSPRIDERAAGRRAKVKVIIRLVQYATLSMWRAPVSLECKVEVAVVDAR
eukprot:2409172-Prymnesium_polylepis.2